uniref:GAGE domain-containing protein n=1 Tax=Steinernema glaseri TaxID=37863 RepID=A0A1I7YVQ9_9BILA
MRAPLILLLLAVLAIHVGSEEVRQRTDKKAQEHKKEKDSSSSEEALNEDGKVEEVEDGDEESEDPKSINTEDLKLNPQGPAPNVVLTPDLAEKIKQAEQLLQAVQMLQKQMEEKKAKQEL